MSTTKVSDLTELSTAADDDVLLITDTSENASKKITKSNLISGLATTTYVDTQVAGKDALSELSGTSDDITEGSTNLFFTSAEQTKLSGIEDSADVTDATNVDAAGAVMNTDTATTSMSFVVDEDTMSSNSATKVPTQQSVKAYVDNAVSAGIHYHTAVRVESPSNLNATYDNGTAGVGATLTNAGANAAISIDGVALSSADRVLVYNQTNAAHNGVYTVTTVGDGSTAWVLTRATDADSYGTADSDALGEGDAFFVSEGNTGAGELYVMNTTGTITFGTTNITFTVIAETAVYDGGTNIDISGTTISLDTSSGVNVTGALSLSGTAITSTAAEINTLDGITATVTELNYTDGVTSNIQTQLDSKQATMSAGSGIDISSNTIAVETDLRDGLTHIGNSTNTFIYWTATDHNFYISGSSKFKMESDGDFHADGDVIAYSTTVSDKRLKENIQPIDDALAKVKQLKGCTFTYTADGKDSAGLIAQDVEKVLPSAVSEKELPLKMDDGIAYKTVQYDQTIGLLVEAIKELTAKVEELENK